MRIVSGTAGVFFVVDCTAAAEEEEEDEEDGESRWRREKYMSRWRCGGNQGAREDAFPVGLLFG